MSAPLIELRAGIRPTACPLEAAFNEGRLLFLRGGERPPTPPDDKQCTADEARWLGYMLERARKIMKADLLREAVREYIEHGHDLPPDFRA